MKIGVNCGHTLSGSGAIGLIKEAEHTRLVGYALMERFRNAGAEVVDCTVDTAQTQKDYLAKTVTLANCEELDWFISIHFNASVSHEGQGIEAYTYQGIQYPEALEVCANMECLGFKNRGIKNGNHLYVIRKTKAKAMLIEVCFCDNQADVELYRLVGAERAVSQAIFDGIFHKEIKKQSDFEEFVGRIAKKDWKERRLVLPSVVVAQAMKESARGTSELARNANALFGIKKNGWQGRIYIKQATEQRLDGSIYAVENTQWRAYDNWEQSILDHNDYIAERSTDGGKTLRYAPVIGCDNYVLACQYLEECGYATAIGYAESLINDYIEKYNLIRFDE